MSWPHTFGALAGAVPLNYLDDNFNAATPLADFSALAVVVGDLPSDAVPLTSSYPGAAGAATDLSRSDHRHPPQTAATFQGGTSYTMTLADVGSVIEFGNPAPITVTIPSLIPGANGLIIQNGVGQVTVVGGPGMNLRNSFSLFKTRATWSVLSWIISSDGTTIILAGDVA